jgi:hypothetical protein
MKLLIFLSGFKNNISRNEDSFLSIIWYTFKCQRCVWSEDTAGDRMPMNQSLNHTSRITFALAPDTHPIQAYQWSLIYYSEKDLTKVEDRLKAIAGLFSRLESRLKCRFYQGFPTSILDAALLFRTLPSSDGTLVNRRGVFPSYSWTGWSGRHLWEDIPDFSLHLGYHLRETKNSTANNKWLNSRTWTIWYSCGIDGILRPLRLEQDHESLRNEPSSILGYRRWNRPPFQISLISN